MQPQPRMSKAETAKRRALAHVLTTAAGLGAFAVAVGQLGFDGAVQLCATRELPPRLVTIFDVLGYRVDQLPSAEGIALIVLATEVRRRVDIATTNNRPITFAEVTAALGAKAKDVTRGLKLLESYGAHTRPPEHYAALGAI